MFGARYFGVRYYGAKYFGHYGATAPVVSGRYLGARYFGRRYWNQAAANVDGKYFGGRYFGHDYFGKRYFASNDVSVPFALEITAGPTEIAPTVLFSSVNLSIGADWSFAPGTLAISTAAMGITAGLTFGNEDWAFTPPLEVTAVTGAMTFNASTLAINFPSGTGRYFGGNYFGSRYFGKRYWGVDGAPFAITLTNSLAMTGTMTVSASPKLSIAYSFTPMAIYGAMAGSCTISDVLPVTQVIGAPGKPPAKKQYMVRVNGERRYVDEHELEVLAETLATQQAEEEARAEKKLKKPRITVEPKRPAMKGEIPAEDKEAMKADALAKQAEIRKLYEQALALARQQMDEEDEEAVLWLM